MDMPLLYCIRTYNGPIRGKLPSDVCPSWSDKERIMREVRLKPREGICME